MPLQDTSRLNGKAYAAAGQAVALLHTMAVLQAYQADLLKDLKKGQGLSPDFGFRLWDWPLAQEPWMSEYDPILFITFKGIDLIYPWIMWPSRRFLWEPPWSSGLQHCNTRACGSLYFQHFLGTWLSEDIYVLAQRLLPFPRVFM